MEDVVLGGHRSSLERIGIPLVCGLRGLPAPRSIAELRLGEAEVSKLRGWAHALRPGSAKQCLRSFQPIPDASCTVVQLFGLVLQALIAEVARRESRDGQIWTVVRRCFRDDTQAELFFQGQPSEFAKDALKFSAQRFELRNAYDLDDAQAWYLTSYLQFGITAHSLHDHLPQRLAGYELLPRPMELLLKGEQRSDSFAQLWRALGDYRRNSLSEERLRSILTDSPWLIPEWTDKVIESAKLLPHLQRATPHSGVSEEYHPEDLSHNLFSRPRLVWDGTSEPMFEVKIVGLADLEDGRYTFFVPDDSVCPQLKFLMIDDEPLGLESMRFSTDAASSSLVVALYRQLDGGPPEHIALEEIRLWNPLEGAALFDEQGWSLDIDTRLDPNKTYTLLLPPDVQLEGQAPYTRTSHGVTAVRLDPGTRDNLQVVLDKEVIWSAASHQQRADLSVKINAEILDSYRGISIGSPLTVIIHDLPNHDTQVTSIRVAGQTLQVQRGHGDVIVVPDIEVPSNMTGLQISIVVRGAVDGQRFVARTSTPPPWKGAQILTHSGWQTIHGDELNLPDLKGAQFRVFTPPALQCESERHPTLFAGNRPLARVSTEPRPRPLNGLAGYGEALTVREDRYNTNQITYMLAEAVINTGIVADLKRVGDWDDVRMWIRNVGQFDPDRFKLHTINELGRLCEAIIEPDGYGCWRALSEDPAVAWLILFGEAIVGQWWRDLPVVAPGAEPQDIPLLARVGHAPLLYAKINEKAHELVRTNPWSVLECWTREVQTPFGEREYVNEAWSAIARELLVDWRCPEDVSGWVKKQLVSWSPTDLIKEFVKTALHFPIVSARLLNGLGDKATINQIASQLCPSTTTDVLRDEIVYRLHVDQGFFDNMARQVADSVRSGAALPDDPMLRSNIAVLCNDDAEFRRWLATYLLEELAQ